MDTKRKPSRLVFLSHHGTDTWIAKQIARELAQCNADSFLDDAHIAVGANFENEIRDALNRADEFLVLLTPWALERPYVWIEMGVAWGRGIPIIGLLLGLTTSDIQAHPRTPAFLKQRDLIALNDVEVYLAQLKHRTGGTNQEVTR